MLLDVDNLFSGYHRENILQGVRMHVDRGEIIGIVGRNGVGKTTLLKTLIGLIGVRRGTITLEGIDITGLGADRRARLGIGYVPQGRDIFPQMSVGDNLRVGELINSKKERPRYDLVFERFPFLKERLAQRGGTLSGGQQQMLAIARALVGDPHILLLDEPSEGIQPSIVEEIGQSLVVLNREAGLTTVVVEQNLRFIQSVAQRVYVMEKGAMVAQLSGDEVSDTERIAEFLTI